MTTLYRFFNDQEALLYVGVTDDLETRLAQHKESKPWWGEVAQVTTMEFGSRRRALEAESRAIFWESPRYNIQGSTRYSADWEAMYHAAQDEWEDERQALGRDINLMLAALEDRAQEIDRLHAQLETASQRAPSRLIPIRELLFGSKT